jgi:hypothetical protein
MIVLNHSKGTKGNENYLGGFEGTDLVIAGVRPVNSIGDFGMPSGSSNNGIEAEEHVMRIAAKAKPNRTVVVPFVVAHYDYEEYDFGDPPVEKTILYVTVEPDEWTYTTSGPTVGFVNPPSNRFVQPPYYYYDRALPEITGVWDGDWKQVYSIRPVFRRNVLDGMAGLYGTLTHNGQGRIDSSLVRAELMSDRYFPGFLNGAYYNRLVIERGGFERVRDINDGTNTTDPGFVMPPIVRNLQPFPPIPNFLIQFQVWPFPPLVGFSLTSQNDTERVWTSDSDPNDVVVFTLSEPMTSSEAVRRILFDTSWDTLSTPAHFFEQETGRILIPPSDIKISNPNGSTSSFSLATDEPALGETARIRLVYSGASGIRFEEVDGPTYAADSISSGDLLWGIGALAPEHLTVLPDPNDTQYLLLDSAG